MELGKKNPEEIGVPRPASGVPPGRTAAVATTLGEDTEFVGTLKFGNSLRIEGKFQGDLSSPGHLYVGRTGQVQAEVKVGSLTVEGKLTGNIVAQDLVDLCSTAEVFGDVSAAKIKIEEGVVFVGKAQIRPSDSKSKPLQKDVVSGNRHPGEKDRKPGGEKVD